MLSDKKKKILRGSIGVTTIGIIVVGSLVITGNKFSRIELAQKEDKFVDIAKVTFLSERKDESLAKVTSRGTNDVRGTVSIEDTTEPVSIEDVKISKSMDLSKRTGLSREDFIELISGVRADTSGFFEENAGYIYDLCEEYSINEIFFCGLISAESGWNIAANHRRTHNYISLMVNGRLLQYDSVEQGLEVAAQKLHKNYLTPGGCFYHGKTLEGVKTCFCPSGTWVDLVYGRMRQII